MSVATELRHLFRGSGFRRLAGTRLSSQLGDGMFQAGLASLLFFDPTKQATANGIALGFLLLLAPFTFVGPFVGPLIDRWQRQRIILIGNLVRLGLSVLLAYLMVTHGPNVLLYVTALISLAINRFLLAAMTAAIPQVVTDEDLLTANSLLPTLGTLAALLGAGVGVLATFFTPGVTVPDDLKAMTALTLAGVAFGISSWISTTIGRRELGPVHPLDAARLREHLRDLVHGLRTGAAYLAQRVTPLHALIIMGLQRFLYGLMFVSSILISRTLLSSPGAGDDGLGQFGLVLVAAGCGFGLAAVVTPTLGHLISRHRWVVTCLLVGAVGQGLLALSSSRLSLLSAAVIVSFAVQGGKIAIDTIVQRDTEDAVRGRAFTLYDMAYNVALMASAALCAVVLPDSGYSVTVMAITATGYVVLAGLYSLAPTEPLPIVASPVAT